MNADSDSSQTAPERAGVHWHILVGGGLLVAVLLKLGVWQLDRAAFKQHQLESAAARRSAPALRIETLSLGIPEAIDGLNVSLSGRYIPEKSVLLVNRMHNGQLGFEVISPFRLDSGKFVVMVSRGWLPAGYQGQPATSIVPPGGEIMLTGTVHINPPNSFFRRRPILQPDWPLKLHQVDPGELARHFELPVFPYPVWLQADNPGSEIAYWPQKTAQPERSTAYAYQWFGMAVIVLVLTIINGTGLSRRLKKRLLRRGMDGPPANRSPR